MNWAWELEELPLRESMVLLILCDQANDAGLCWPSQETIARKARLSERSVQRAVAVLKKADLIEVRIRATTAGRKSSMYRVNVGSDYSASGQQSDRLAGSEDELDVPSVENPDSPQEPCYPPDWRIADEPVDNSLQDDTGGGSLDDTAVGLLPYGKENHQIEPPTNHARSASPTPVGVDGEGPSQDDAPPDGVERPDWALLDACLPAPMRHGLTTAAGKTITTALQSAHRAGWSSGQIYRALNENPLPEAMRNRTGLVIHRIQQIAQTPGPAARRRIDHWPDTRAANPVPMPADVRALFQKTTTGLAPRKEAR